MNTNICSISKLDSTVKSHWLHLIHSCVTALCNPWKKWRNKYDLQIPTYLPLTCISTVLVTEHNNERPQTRRSFRFLSHFWKSSKVAEFIFDIMDVVLLEKHCSELFYINMWNSMKLVFQHTWWTKDSGG